jgi:hypothetical protein
MRFSPPFYHFIPFLYNILSILLSNTLSLCSSLNVRDQVSHPYRTTGKIIALRVPIFTFFQKTGNYLLNLHDVTLLNNRNLSFTFIFIAIISSSAVEIAARMYVGINQSTISHYIYISNFKLNIKKV